MPRPVRVLHVLGSLDSGGAENFIMNIYRAIDRTRVQFDFVKHTDKEQFFDEEIRKLGGRIFACPRYNGVNHFLYCKWWKEFFLAHPEHRVIHGHMNSTASIYLHIAHRCGRRTIAHSHSTSNGSGLAAFAKDMLQKRICASASYLFACSDQAALWLFGKGVLARGNYKRIPNAIDCNRFAYSEMKREETRQRLCINKELVVGHVGRLTEAKNHMFLLDVFCVLHEKCENSRLLLIGDGELREPLEARCEQLGLAGAVHFLGSRKDVESYYQAMDVMLLPSLWEGFPVVIVEAQAAGLPCFVSNEVTKEVKISELVEFLPISQGSNLWAEKILGADLHRKNVRGNIVRNHFDVQGVSKWLENFYMKISR